MVVFRQHTVCVHLHAHYFSLDSVQDGTTPLYVAAKNGHLMVVELLIVAKAQVDIQDEVKFNCLYLLRSINCLCTGWVDSVAHSQSKWPL